MKYELAKKLKDAGFPHPEVPPAGSYDSWTIRDTYGQVYSADGKTILRIFPGMTYVKDYVYVPSLHEIIEECGINFRSLHSYFGGHLAEGWYSCNHQTAACLHGQHRITFTGKTLEEAVAQLYIAIKLK